jgi:hypothetical protein
VTCESDTDGRFTSTVFFISVCLYESRVSCFLVLRIPTETAGEAATASVGAEAAAGAIEDDVEVRADASIKKEAAGA